MQNLYRTAAVVTIFSAFEHCLGFLYRIILSRVLGSEGLGVYQVSLTVFAVFLTITSSGLPITLSRVMTKHYANRDRKSAQSAVSASALLTLCVSVPITILLYIFRAPFSKIFSDPRCADLFYILILSLSFTSVYAILRGSFWGDKRFFIYSLVELIEEIVMIFMGVFLLVVLNTGLNKTNLAAVAVLISYFASFTIAIVYYFAKGGKFSSPKGQIKPLLSASLPVTAMRASSSLVSSLISVLFPARLVASGVSPAKALSEYGVIYGMVMPILMIPSTLIGSIALVLVPNLSEKFYKKDKEALSALVEKALNSTLLIAGILVPFFIVCGIDVGVMLYSNPTSGKLITYCAVMLFPLSLTMICTSVLNSLQCERHTLVFFLCGSALMLLCVWLLPKYLGSGALVVGMACDYLLTAICSLALLRKKTGKLRSAHYFVRLAVALLPILLIGALARSIFIKYFSYLPAFALTVLVITACEIILFTAFKLVDIRAILRRFTQKSKRKAQITA